MSKKYSNAGKGDKSRITDKKKFNINWEKIYSKKKKKTEDDVTIVAGKQLDFSKWKKKTKDKK